MALTWLQKSARKWLGVDALSAVTGGNWMSWFAAPLSSSGIRINAERAMQIAAVWRCINIKADAIASMPLVLYERTGNGKERAATHPLWRVLHDAPNTWQTSVEWRRMLQAHIDLRGNAYCLIIPGPLGSVSELLPMNPDRMKVELMDNRRLRYTYTDEQGRPVYYRQDQIFHLRGLSNDGIVGMSTLAAARNAMGLAVATEDHGARLFKNGARPGVVFKAAPGTSMKPEARDELRNSWERMHAGSENQFRTAVLPAGLEPVELGLSNDDAQFLDTRKFQVKDIARFFGVPPHKVYDLERATFSNIEHQGLEFVQDTLLPIARTWEAAISRDLIADDETYFAEFLFEFYLRGDNASRATFYREMLNIGVLSVNEIRTLENLNGIGPDGDKRYMQLNMTTLDRIGKEPAETPPPEPPSDPAEDTEDEPGDLSAPLAAAWGVYNEALGKFVRWEADAIDRLAGKGGNFLNAIEEFYVGHKERVAKGMHAPMRLLSTLGVEADEINVLPLLDAHLSALVDAAGNATTDTLKTVIENLTATWRTEVNTQQEAA